MYCSCRVEIIKIDGLLCRGVPFCQTKKSFGKEHMAIRIALLPQQKYLFGSTGTGITTCSFPKDKLVLQNGTRRCQTKISTNLSSTEFYVESCIYRINKENLIENSQKIVTFQRTEKMILLIHQLLKHMISTYKQFH